MATIIASPIASSSKNDDFTKEWISEERVEQSSTLFSQLDSMIAAVQSESSALDNMRNKVKELDVMKDQVANLNRRLLEADETNFAMKATLVRQQEQIVDSRKSQTEVCLFVQVCAFIAMCYIEPITANCLDGHDCGPPKGRAATHQRRIR